MGTKKNPNHIFRNIKVYSSTEWLADNKKKYRSVFDKNESTYIYTEFSFFNLHFKKKEWDLKLELVCRDQSKNEVARLNCDRTISPNSNLIFIREGWGTYNKGGYWQSGTYTWEAWLDNELIAEKNFYLQEVGEVTALSNPYFDLDSIKFYEGPFDNVKEGKRVFFQQFSDQETRYIWAEITCKNKARDLNFWNCEMVFNFHTNSHLLKGSVSKLMFVYKQDDKFTLSVGWGADTPGSWMKGKYYLDIIFMDHLIKKEEFFIGKDFVEYLVLEDHRSATKRAELSAAPIKKKDVEKTLSELNDLIGLDTVKDRIKEYSNYLEFISLRKNKGLNEEDQINLNCVFKGNPGTGKTTIARKLGKIYKQLGLLSKGHVHEVDRSDLVAEFIGQTAPKTKAAIKKAEGGILFIDEAYSLARKDDDNKDFGKEAIEILLKELSDGKDIAIIAAGYPDEMDIFLESNPGLKSRFRMIYDFPDYTPQELLQITDVHAKKKGISFAPDAKELYYKKVVEAYRNRDQFFGNARLIVSLIEEAKLNLGIRVMGTEDPAALSVEELSVVNIEDVEQISVSKKSIIPDIPIDEELLEISVKKLEGLIGIDSVKEEIKSLVKLVRYYKETDQDVQNSFSLHSVFTGNPGTGKTTVARILAQIYKALGILERGNLVECDRQSLIGGYVGQTAIKTGEMIDKAMGGVLFIDEAYALTEGGNSDYGKEAIEIILKRMEDFRGQFIVIAAGYTDNMTRFIESNPGLKSRFDRIFEFEDFDTSLLMSIAQNQLSDAGFSLAAASEKSLLKLIENMYKGKDKYFGNGRSVRKIVEEAIRNQHLRMSEMEPGSRTNKMIKTILAKDIDSIAYEDKSTPEVLPKLGFRISN
ncbi:MAG: SpoVK/Ycf46/Vps4 family AAA+-type ATPase [Paracoccaceae bacterium]|jgi:SpoVK/Ycf46/Vps4 family AAA+-type ATPase